MQPLSQDAPLTAARWLAAKNVDGDAVPSFGLVKVTGSDSYYVPEVEQPGTDGEHVWVCGPGGIDADTVGAVTSDFPAWALYDSGDGTPAVGETWGAGAGSWKLRKDKPGFRIVGEPDTTTEIVPVERKTSGAASPLTTKGDIWGYSTLDARIPVGTNGQVLSANSAQSLGVEWVTPSGGTVTSVTVREDDGTPSYTFTDSLQLRFDQADGFVVSQPGAGVAKVDIQAGAKAQAGVVSTSAQEKAGKWTVLGSTTADATNRPAVVSEANDGAGTAQHSVYYDEGAGDGVETLVTSTAVTHTYEFGADTGYLKVYFDTGALIFDYQDTGASTAIYVDSLSAVSLGGSYVILPAQTAASMPNESLFHDTADGKLKWKDSGGTVNALY